MANGEAIRIKMLAEASDADITDNAVAVVSVEDSAAATGYTTKKSLLSRIKDYIIGKVSISSLGDGTVTGAIAQNADDILTTAEAIGATSISGIGDGTVTGAISSLNNDFANKGTTYTYSKSLAVSASTVATIQTVSIPTGKWLVLSYMRISNAGSSVYNHMLNSRVVRNTEVNGGGSVNWLLINGTASVNVQAYVSRDTTVENEVTIIRLA